MFKVWVSEGGYRLTLIVSHCSRLILTKDNHTVLSKQYDWERAKIAQGEAEALAHLGHMKLLEVQTWR